MLTQYERAYQGRLKHLHSVDCEFHRLGCADYPERSMLPYSSQVLSIRMSR